jgi:hypothetical protein
MDALYTACAPAGIGIPLTMSTTLAGLEAELDDDSQVEDGVLVIVEVWRITPGWTPEPYKFSLVHLTLV